jgi:hypothetical protein
MSLSDTIRLDDLVELQKFTERYPDVASEARIRWWTHTRASNGIESSGAVVKRMGRWFVVVPRMRDWILRSDAA